MTEGNYLAREQLPRPSSSLSFLLFEKEKSERRRGRETSVRFGLYKEKNQLHSARKVLSHWRAEMKKKLRGQNSTKRQRHRQSLYLTRKRQKHVHLERKKIKKADEKAREEEMSSLHLFLVDNPQVSRLSEISLSLTLYVAFTEP